MTDSQSPQNTPSAPPSPSAPVPDAAAPLAQERPGGAKKRPARLAIAALIVGVLAIIFAFTPGAGFGLFLAVVGIVLAIVALVKNQRMKGASITGLILSVVAIPLSIIFLVVYAIAGAVAGSAAASDATSTSAGTTPAASQPSESAVAPAKDTVNWYTDTYGAFTPATQNGTGDAVVTLPAGAKSGMVTATHTGSSNFSIAAMDANNASTIDLLVNTIGNYSGVTAYGLNGFGNDAASLKITADGAWTVTIAPISSAPAATVPGTATGDQVFRYDGKAANWTLTNTGEGNFSVIQYSKQPMPNLAVNGIGSYSGTVPMQAGPSVVVVKSDGSWTVK